LRGHTNKVECAEFSPQGDLIATGSDDRTVRLWNVETGACTRTLAGHANGIKDVAYSPQGDPTCVCQ
jgi:WD40 repeat protein